MTKISVFRFQFFRFISLTPESLTPETSNSEIRNPKFLPSLARFVLILSATRMMKYPG